MTIHDVAPADEFDIKPIIRSVIEREELSQDDAWAAMDAIMRGAVSNAQIAALVTGLRMKDETVAEIAGFASAMRHHALTVTIAPDGRPLLDTCGTGGDHSNSFNISTTATFVIAAAGVRIAKHGNRAASSLSGSADLLEALGVVVDLTSDEVARTVEEVGVGFMFAQAFHPALRFAGPARREIGVRTIFNMLGPLTNPAGATHQLIGVGHPEIAGKLATVLASLGSQRVVLVHSADGLDEVGIAGESQITEWDRTYGDVRRYSIAPEQFGLTRGAPADLRGGDPVTNAGITRSILGGERGSRRDVIVMNAGAGIYAAEGAESIADGIEIAAAAIDSGDAERKLEDFVATTSAIVSERSETAHV